jgi:hypothetical protein
MLLTYTQTGGVKDTSETALVIKYASQKETYFIPPQVNPD